MGADIALRRRLDRGARATGRAARSTADAIPDPGRGDDARGRRAVRDGTEHAAQHRQLARQGNRPHRGDGHRAAQARRDGRGGRRLASSVPRSPRLPATIDTYDDHRMAMCFSLAALGGVPVAIHDPGCVRKTFPEYFERFASPAPMTRRAGYGDPPSRSSRSTVRRRRARARSRACRRRAGLPLPRQRRPVPAGRAEGAAHRDRSRRRRGARGSRDRSTCVSRRAAIRLDGAT